MDKTQEISYFSSLNKMCCEIMKEKVSFTSLLGDQWDSLPLEEQDSLLDEHFVAPHIQQLYNATNCEDEKDDTPSFFPVFKIKGGQKIVEDDEGETWQDEHSGPFSWETSSQSEFSMDFNNTETLRNKTFDVKRPKSPRLARSGSGELAGRFGALERAGSTDFQQLRHIWETHLSLTPADDATPPLSSLLSKSQSSLSGELSALNKKLSASVNSIVECEDETEETNETTQAITPVVKNPVKPVEEDAPHPSPSTSVKFESHTKVDTKEPVVAKEQVAPLATKEDDEDIAHAMEDDIIKLSEIQTSMKESLAGARSTANEEVKSTTEAVKEKEDILTKFGVTFSYGDSPDAPKQASAESEESSAPLPVGFDFLSSW
ncbi:uncharacterized protein C1orf198 homolog isoform X1 [Watersipora subatra]|uniref:uncharacterized protein C1orf198 homolog isoform X1 n=1 Tax=Watersipora subatra TaxID=2589382 RepID=UPI00355C2D3C